MLHWLWLAVAAANAVSASSVALCCVSATLSLLSFELRISKLVGFWRWSLSALCCYILVYFPLCSAPLRSTLIGLSLSSAQSYVATAGRLVSPHAAPPVLFYSGSAPY